MATDKQIAANQRNARRSTGPKSVEGKISSRLNAIRHGLTADQVIIPGEDPDEFDSLSATLTEEFSPEGELESRLVERIATCMWRLRRLTTVEAGIFAHGSYSLEMDRASAAMHREITADSTIPGTPLYEKPTLKDIKAHKKKVWRQDAARESMLQRVPTLGVTFIRDAKGGDALGKLSRYEASIERSLYRALHELQRLQAARKSGKASAPVVVDVILDVDPISDND